MLTELTYYSWKERMYCTMYLLLKPAKNVFFVPKMYMTAPSMFSCSKKLISTEALYLGIANDLFLVVSLSRLIMLCMV